MKRMFGMFIATGVLGAMVLSAQPAAAQPSSDELKCQTQAGGKIIPKFVLKKSKCIVKCEQLARKGKGMATDCDAPYAGDTAACIAKEEGKSEAGYGKGKCAVDCPECYSGGNCTTEGMSRTAITEAQVDTVGPLVYCDDSGSPDMLNADEGKCQDGSAKTLSKHVLKVAKATAKCVKKGNTDCAPGPTRNAELEAKIADLSGKNAAKIDDKCSDKPECWNVSFDTGSEQILVVNGLIDSNYAAFYCSSPSGAFLN